MLSCVLLVALTACAAWQPTPLTLPNNLGNVQTKQIGDVQASVAILTAGQSRAHFGVDLDELDIQAIWIQVRNNSGHQLWFLRSVLDADFYPADEIAMLANRLVPAEQHAALQQYLRDESMVLQLRPGTTSEGFVFTPKAIGGRYVDVRLVQDAYELALLRTAAQERGATGPDPADLEFRFGFAIPLPDGMFDFERLDPEKTYAGMELPDLSLEELRRELAALPCCSTDADGERDGDPINTVIVGSAADTLNSLSRSGWSFTHRITARSVGRLVGATLSETPYPVAPVSDLHAFGRKQDFALQRARPSIARRNHMRLWLAPFTHRGEQVWVGQVSRDIGIKLTPKAPTLTTHIIDPEVDQAREYLLQSLLAGGFVEAFGFVRGARRSTASAPAVNLVDDPYFSDGLRLVLLLSPDPVSYGDVRSLLWERSAAPVAEGQTSGRPSP